MPKQIGPTTNQPAVMKIDSRNTFCHSPLPPKSLPIDNDAPIHEWQYEVPSRAHVTHGIKRTPCSQDIWRGQSLRESLPSPACPLSGRRTWASFVHGSNRGDFLLAADLLRDRLLPLPKPIRGSTDCLTAWLLALARYGSEPNRARHPDSISLIDRLATLEHLGIDVTHTDLLQAAARKNNYAMMRVLSEAGADLNYALFECANDEDKAACRALIQAGAQPWRASNIAMKQGRALAWCINDVLHDLEPHPRTSPLPHGSDLAPTAQR